TVYLPGANRNGLTLPLVPTYGFHSENQLGGSADPWRNGQRRYTVEKEQKDEGQRSPGTTGVGRIGGLKLSRAPDFGKKYVQIGLLFLEAGRYDCVPGGEKRSEDARLSLFGFLSFARTRAMLPRLNPFTTTLASLTLVLGTAGRSAADVLDLTTNGAQGVLNGALFQQGSVQPSGTGVFSSFLRIQMKGTEQGYNTD